MDSTKAFQVVISVYVTQKENQMFKISGHLSSQFYVTHR